MNKNLTHVSHDCIPIFIKEDSHILILGSLPSVKSREEGFYYAHKQNRFFKVLAHIHQEDEPISIEERKNFLIAHHIALYDVIYECDICGSSDSSITNAKPIDIESVLRKYPNIKVIAINGGKAKSLFDKYLLNKVSKGVCVIYLPSTSPANAKMSINNLIHYYSILVNL